MRGTTFAAGIFAWVFGISIHVPREGDDGYGAPMLEANLISIHVPREGDDIDNQGISRKGRISIHVPREGDDASRRRSPPPGCDFNPRPP